MFFSKHICQAQKLNGTSRRQRYQIVGQNCWSERASQTRRGRRLCRWSVDGGGNSQVASLFSYSSQVIDYWTFIREMLISNLWRQARLQQCRVGVLLSPANSSLHSHLAGTHIDSRLAVSSTPQQRKPFLPILVDLVTMNT